MPVKEHLARESDSLNFEAAQLAALYAEFADEDRRMAEEGMVEYNIPVA